MVGGLLGSRTTLGSTFLATCAFAFSVVAMGWRDLEAAGAEFADAVVAVVEVDAAARVLTDEEPVPGAVVDGLTRDPELEDDTALRTGLFGSAGEGRGEVVVDFDGGRVRFFPDLAAGTNLFVLFEENIDFVGDFGAGPAFGTAVFVFASALIGFASALTGFASALTGFASALTGFASALAGFASALAGLVGSSASFPVDFESSGFCGMTSACLMETISGLGGNPVPMGEKGGAVYPFRVSRSCFLRFASSSGCFLWAGSPGSPSFAVPKGPPNSFAPSEIETTGLIGLDGDVAFSPRIGLPFPWTATNDVLTLPRGLGPGLWS